MKNGAERLRRLEQRAPSAEIQKASGVFRKTAAPPASDVAPESLQGRTQGAETVWDSCAEAYDEFSASISTYFSEEALRRVRLTAGARVLDVGAGTGAFASGASQRGAQVLAVDGILPKDSLADASFDVVSSLFGSMLLSAHDQGLRELARVLKPSGHVVLSLATTDLLRFSATPQLAGPSDEQRVKDRLGKVGFCNVQILTIRQAFSFSRAESLYELLPVATPAWTQLLRRLKPAERDHTMKLLLRDLRKRQGNGPFSITCEALLAVAQKPSR